MLIWSDSRTQKYFTHVLVRPLLAIDWLIELIRFDWNKAGGYDVVCRWSNCGNTISEQLVTTSPLTSDWFALPTSFHLFSLFSTRLVRHMEIVLLTQKRLMYVYNMKNFGFCHGSTLYSMPRDSSILYTPSFIRSFYQSHAYSGVHAVRANVFYFDFPTIIF